jgi:uncharacterized protein
MKNKSVTLNIQTFHEGKNEIHLTFLPEDLDIHCTVPHNPITCDMKLTKKGHDISVEGVLTFTFELECSRCSEQFKIDKNESFTAYFLQRTEPAHQGEVSLSPDKDTVEYYDNTVLDLTSTVRDTIHLAVPMKALCREGCKGFCPLCGINLNKKKCNCKREKVDPRWEPLKKLTQNK